MAKKRGGKRGDSVSSKPINEDYILFLKILIPSLGITWVALLAYSLAAYFKFGYINIILYVIVGLFLLLILLMLIHHEQRRKSQSNEIEKVKPAVKEDDVAKILRIVDSLLEELPDSAINKFSKSKEFKLYKKVLNEHGIK